MNKAAEVVKFYALCNKLKDVVRTGWKDVWKVKRERLESVAEHVYGTQMLALAMWSVYKYELNIERVVLMLAVHELEEAAIGDVIPFDTSREEKKKMGREAVKMVLTGILDEGEILELMREFGRGETVEAKFAYYCDKLEAGIQIKMYEEEGAVSMAEQVGNKMLADEEVQKYVHEGVTCAEVWLDYNRDKHGFDRNFAEVSDYVRESEVR